MYVTQNAPMAGVAPQPTPFSTPIDVGCGYVMPPLGRVFHVRGDGTTVTNLDDQYSAVTTSMERRLWPSVSSVLASGALKANRGDVIEVLPGHTENISTADAWPMVSGLRIIGHGDGSLIPTFTFTAAAAQVLMNDANCSISGCRFLCAGPAGTTALTVTAPFVMSAVGCKLERNEFEVGIDADQICGTFLTVSAARCSFNFNTVECQAAAAAITDLIVLTAADKFIMDGNDIVAAVTTAATGLVRAVTTASTEIRITRNILHNILASSTGGLNFNAALACTGKVQKNLLVIEDATSVAAIVMNAANSIRLDQNYVQNEKNKTAIQIGTAVD